MKETHFILRSTPAATRDLFLGVRSLESTVEPVAANLKLDVADIDRRDLPALTSHPDVIAAAPSMPMKLIAPVAVKELPGAVAPGVAWGVHAVGADTSPFSGKGIVVAVLDTGIDASHPAFAGIAIVEKDFTGDGNGDQHGHGTHCAGTIFGRTTNGQRIGVAPGVEKVLIGKVIGLEGGPSEKIASAVLWAVDNGAHVISMSLGIDFPGFVARLEKQGLPTELATSRALEGYRANVQLFTSLADFVQARGAFSQATLMVAAAGNESRTDVNPDFEIAVSPPAAAKGIISVAALANSKQGFFVAPFSNKGANVSGPGVEITSAKRGGGLTTMSGTSMAAPHVAGAAALWAEQIQGTATLNTFQLTARLVGSANSAGFKSGFKAFDVGLGMVRAPQA